MNNTLIWPKFTCWDCEKEQTGSSNLGAKFAFCFYCNAPNAFEDWPYMHPPTNGWENDWNTFAKIQSGEL